MSCICIIKKGLLDGTHNNTLMPYLRRSDIDSIRYPHARNAFNPLPHRDAFLTLLQIESNQIRQLFQELPDQGLLYLLMEI